MLSGERVPKNHSRMQAYGDVDELNSAIGGIVASLPKGEGLSGELTRIQSELFSVGAWLATTPGSGMAAQLTQITDVHEKRLEGLIDALQEALPPLRSFILPGGHVSAAFAHLARTVCRRAERSALSLRDSLDNEEERQALQPTLVYLNRLSDYLFAVARRCNQLAGIDDVSLNE